MIVCKRTLLFAQLAELSSPRTVRVTLSQDFFGGVSRLFVVVPAVAAILVALVCFDGDEQCFGHARVERRSFSPGENLLAEIALAVTQREQCEAFATRSFGLFGRQEARL